MTTVLAAAVACGCSAGMGPTTAATRGLFGGPWSNDDARMWVPSKDQSHVPDGFVRIESVSDGFAKIFDYVSITSGVRKGSAHATLAGVDQGDREVIDLELTLTARPRLPVGNLAIGGGHFWHIEGDTGLRGFGVKGSFAPIAQVSIDAAHAWVHDEDTGATGGHTYLGGTLLLFGVNMFRFGISVAKTWSHAGDYESDGYMYSLVSTMY